MENKTCKVCKKTLPVSCFTITKTNKDGYHTFCKSCKALNERAYRRTVIGKIKNTYLSMKRRVENRNNYKYHKIYEGKAILAKDDFISWSVKDPEFNRLFTQWKESNYDSMLNPSIDRKDATKGYTLDNIQWLTMRQNCSEKGKGK